MFMSWRGGEAEEAGYTCLDSRDLTIRTFLHFLIHLPHVKRGTVEKKEDGYIFP
jgi:hypothetical protein